MKERGEESKEGRREREREETEGIIPGISERRLLSSPISGKRWSSARVMLPL